MELTSPSARPGSARTACYRCSARDASLSEGTRAVTYRWAACASSTAVFAIPSAAAARVTTSSIHLPADDPELGRPDILERVRGKRLRPEPRRRRVSRAGHAGVDDYG